MKNDENNNPISKEVTLYGDPLAPYKNRTGAYIDADEDNIPDIVESLLSNNSTFLKFAQFFHNSNSEYYNKTIWDNYNWTIAYFYSIALKGSSLSDAEIKFYSILDNITSEPEYYIPFYEDRLRSKGNDKYTENATQWLRDEFNPLITESMPPVITQFAAVSDVGFFYAYTKVSVELRDPSGIGTIILISKPEKNSADIYDIRIFDAGGNTTWSIENLKLNITATSSTWHYYVVCNATDSLGNTAQWSKEIKGVLKVIVDTVAKALGALWGFLCEVGETLAKAVNILVDWLRGIILGGFNALLGERMSVWEEEIMDILLSYYGGITKGVSSNNWSKALKVLNMFTEIFKSTLFRDVMLLWIALQILFLALMPYWFILLPIMLGLTIAFADYIITYLTDAKLSVACFANISKISQSTAYNNSSIGSLYILELLLLALSSTALYFSLEKSDGISIIVLFVSALVAQILLTTKIISKDALVWIVGGCWAITFISLIYSVSQGYTNAIMTIFGSVTLFIAFFLDMYILWQIMNDGGDHQ